MLKKIALLFATIKHLKFIQIKYQIIYRINKPKILKAYNRKYKVEKITFLEFKKKPPVYTSWITNHHFEFLNLKVDFEDEIDWNFQENGKLWNYNLQYGNYLLQDNISNDDKIKLLTSLYSWLNTGKLPLEPYPVSLRIINVIRLLCNHKIKPIIILENLHAELDFLSKRPEYHLLGNHLLENAFALIMGGAFFDNLKWINQGELILKDELEEQILSDGAHFELSPMYHQIIFFRLLELIDWYGSWENKKGEFYNYLKEKAGKMYSWLNHMTFKNGDIPHFNDSAEGIAYDTYWLGKYAETLAIELNKKTNLGASGYRFFRIGNYECVIDAAAIGPAYQPGHGHADALSFILYKDNMPLFVEQGTSTYQSNHIRQIERSTSSHNTVVVGGKNQSEVYAGFRVGRRAYAKIIFEDNHSIIAAHNGYQNEFNINHIRTFDFHNKSIFITDELNQNIKAKACFHFHPNINIQKKDEFSYLIDFYGTITFENCELVKLETYEYSSGFNNVVKASKLLVSFISELKTTISFNIN